MKKSFFIILIGLTMLAGGCKTIEMDCKDSVPAYESVSGYVFDDAGNAIKDIRIEVFLDENLEKNYWQYYNPVEANDCYCVYTDESGYFSVGQASEYRQGGPEYKDVYIVASDTLGVYKREVKQAQIVYSHCGVGNGTAEFVMAKF